VQCGDEFVFGAAEQKFWYETLGFRFESHATQCLACRRLRRSDRALERQLAAASVAARERSDDAARQLALAEAIVRYFERRQQGSLDRAIAACRKARRLLRGYPPHEIRETLFWEGVAHALAGRLGAARELLGKFLASGIGGRRQALLAKEARRWLS
jgi:hypothetical protein